MLSFRVTRGDEAGFGSRMCAGCWHFTAVDGADGRWRRASASRFGTREFLAAAQVWINFTGAMLAIATLIGRIVQGAGPHTLDEHILVDSLAYRGKLFAGILAALV